MDGHHTIAQWLGNVISAGTIVGAMLGWLPTAMTVAGAAVALIWYIIQIRESRSYREWHAKRHALRIARLKAKLLLLETKPAPMPPEIEDRL